ncbi:cytochrome c5 family protein [Solimonas sp. K1W22B-7]|uniref:c-type cytochrome n=1 Tax=Solimonas sp. K1W22B-7 TaxID=2303331 RepID=UPI000E334766|nr:c-type cytochrome [Solimonas sp. K1W22B-7]AXQ29812.1 cytochrome c5 family protein [Solimonas sp. K1W22B-7]
MRVPPSPESRLKPGLRAAACGLALLLLAACGKGEQAAPASTPAPAAPAAAAAAPVTASAGAQATYERSCKACHAVPGTGAPQTGDAKAWQPRVAQGIDTLLDHTIQGYNGMPPLGNCMECSEDEFITLIELMSGATFEH